VNRPSQSIHRLGRDLLKPNRQASHRSKGGPGRVIIVRLYLRRVLSGGYNRTKIVDPTTMGIVWTFNRRER
jgi:hypothetical protein